MCCLLRAQPLSWTTRRVAALLRQLAAHWLRQRPPAAWLLPCGWAWRLPCCLELESQFHPREPTCIAMACVCFELSGVSWIAAVIGRPGLLQAQALGIAKWMVQECTHSTGCSSSAQGHLRSAPAAAAWHAQLLWRRQRLLLRQVLPLLLHGRLLRDGRLARCRPAERPPCAAARPAAQPTLQQTEVGAAAPCSDKKQLLRPHLCICKHAVHAW